MMKPSSDTNDQRGPDNNANVEPPDQSRGAIPKTKPVRQKSVKRPIKINNNVEDVGALHNCNISVPGSCLSNTETNHVESELYEDSQIDSSCSSCVIGETTQTSVIKPFKKVAICEPDDSPEDSKNDVVENENSDSSTEDDLLSISDDGCIYTYKGDQVADLPSSFFSIDVPVPAQEMLDIAANIRQQTSSPEMDFLEMDFDPGPLDGDSECGDIQQSELDSNQKVNGTLEKPETTAKPCNIPSMGLELNSTNLPLLNKRDSPRDTPSTSSFFRKKDDSGSIMPWSCSINHRTVGSNVNRTSKRFHCQRGELISPNEKFPSDYQNMLKQQYYIASNGTTEHTEESSMNVEGSSAMIWSESEACLRQFTQIGPSACGATAVLNVLTALRFPVPPIEKLQELVNTRLRANSSPLTEYLQSRSVAGTTHEDLIEGLLRLSDGKIYARFFHLHPERVINLEAWLMYWISNGAVPIATLNLQRCSGTIPDAWHHQMIYGVGPKGVYLTNPLESVEASKLWPQLCSESTLLIRRDDVISRWNYRTDLPQLMNITDVRWRQLNVVGQVANMIHEHRRELKPGFVNTSHIKIPASYSSGITLAVHADSEMCTFLQQCPDLPLLHDNNVASISSC